MDKQQQQKEGEEKEGFSLVSLDESFFFYDSRVRRVWVDKEKRPIVRVTGSHRHLCLFGAMDIEGKQLFRQYQRFNGDTFLEFLKTIHSRFSKCHLFMDKASPHYRSRKVRQYFEENKDAHDSRMPPNSVTRVYGDGGGIEHGQKMICWCYHAIRHLQILKTGYPAISGQKDST